MECHPHSKCRRRSSSSLRYAGFLSEGFNCALRNQVARMGDPVFRYQMQSPGFPISTAKERSIFSLRFRHQECQSGRDGVHQTSYLPPWRYLMMPYLLALRQRNSLKRRILYRRGPLQKHCMSPPSPTCADDLEEISSPASSAEFSHCRHRLLKICGCGEGVIGWRQRCL